MAKLGNAPVQPAPNASSDPSASSLPAQSKLPSSAPQPSIQSSAQPVEISQNPFRQLGLGNSATPHPTQSNIRTEARVAKSQQVGVAPAVKESLEEWEHKTLSSIFRLTLDESKKQDFLGHKLQYVPGVAQELQDQDVPISLNLTILEQAILEAASNTAETPFQYMLGCWKRVSKQYKTIRTKNDEKKLSIIKEARRICMSYCIFAVTMADTMFGRDTPSSSPLVQHLLVNPDDDHGLCHDFLQEITSRFAEDETAVEAMVTAVEDLSRQLAQLTMNDNYKPYALALRHLVRYPALVSAITQSSLFLPENTEASTFEVETLLGPFFQLSPLQANVTDQFFSSPKTRDSAYITQSQNALRMTLRTHQQELFDIVNHIVKTAKEPRERMLDWFARCININHKRRALQVDKKTVSSDGFMINVTVCLDQLCEPFMDASFSKIDRIEVEYLRRSPRIEIKDETKLNADQSTSDNFYSQVQSGQNNFISEIFFLTLAGHHYGTEAVHQSLSQLEKDLKYMEKHIAALEADRDKFVHNQTQLAMFDRAVAKHKTNLDRGLSYKLAVQGVLLDDLTQTRSMQFMRYVIVWLMRLVSADHEFPRRPLKLPLPDEQLEVFRCLPEYFIEDVVDNFKFITRNMPQIITTTQSDELVMLCITFLRSSEYIKNPYLKAGIVTILFYGTWPLYGRGKGVLGEILNNLPFANEHLLQALMNFYIEVENTGAHTQFYDKFNIRYEIFQIIKCVWSNAIYRDRLSREATVNLDFFVRFVNLLLNDVTFVLDESLSAFAKIHDLQNLLRSPEGAALEANERADKESALSDAEGKAKSYMQLTNETVAMLKLFTSTLADSFTRPEIVQRLADMLDYNLDTLVGPKSSQLMVDKKEEYGFNPKVLLSEITDVYLNLAEKENFILAVARDGRSYKAENFEKATKIFQGRALKSPEEIQSWKELSEKFRKAKESDDQLEEDLGEVPDEFLGMFFIFPHSQKAID